MVPMITLAMITLAAAMVSPHTHMHHRMDFLHACHRGDLTHVHQSLMDTYEAVAAVLDEGLVVSSGRGHLHVMHYLMGSGAINVDLALYSAAVHNQVDACKFLVSKDRETPASDLEVALTGARKHKSIDAEFYLTIRQTGLYDLTD